MHTVECQLIFAGLLILLMQLSNALPLGSSINELISNSSDKLGLVKYFNELKLDMYCNNSLLDNDDFKKLEPIDPSQCLCTVIYNMTKELESSNISISDVKAAKLQTKINYESDEKTFQIWKNVTKLSPSLKLLMEPLNDIKAWKFVCHKDYSMENLGLLCQFLNVEIMLLYNSTHKLYVKNTITEASENYLKPLKSKLKPEEQNKSEDPPATSKAMQDEDTIKNDEPLPFDPINDKEEQLETSNKYDENTIQDDQTESDKDLELTTEFKSSFKSNNDNSKDDDNTILSYTETKETQSIISQKNAFGGPEETHFLFYFGIMTLFSMLFYLALYNKKKIIALVIEGRRSTNHRRRPNSVNYSKVETDDGLTVF